MRSGKARRCLCWGAALLLAVLGILGVPMLYLYTGNDTLLAGYLLNALSQTLSFAAPALLVLYAVPKRWERFQAALRPLTMRTVGFSALTAVAAAVVVALLALLWSALLQGITGRMPPADPVLSPRGWGEWLLALLSMAFVPAFAEELLFRALLQDTLQSRLGRWGLWIAAAVFAALHFKWFAFPALLLLGVLLGLLYKRYGLFGSALFHGLYNASTLALAAGNTRLTSMRILLCMLCFAFSVKALLKGENNHEADRTGL